MTDRGGGGEEPYHKMARKPSINHSILSDIASAAEEEKSQ
jgi:hypothetical protein